MDVIAVIQVVLSVILIILVLLQRNEASVGAAFGGGDEGPAHTRRGPEKVIFITTIIVAILFAGSSIAALLY